MDEVLTALGWHPGPAGRARLVGLVVGISAAFTIAGWLPSSILGHPAWLVQAVLWLPWLFWLDVLFPRHYRTAGRTYRDGFRTHVALGISWNFAQMTRPALFGVAALLDGSARLSPAPVLAGLLIAAVGGGMITAALRAIGFSRALFLGEYSRDQNTVVFSGIYTRMRHPLYVGGMTISVGASVFFATADTLTVGLVNAAVLPLYRIIEDRRCRLALPRYDGYALAVPGILPRLRAGDLPPD